MVHYRMEDDKMDKEAINELEVVVTHLRLQEDNTRDMRQYLEGIIRDWKGRKLLNGNDSS